MKNCGIVCEYNPFHTGHAYQLDRVRACGADNIVCVMSGAFVQSAMPAFCDKALRAKCAVLGGADAVIELPTVYSTASAQMFAEGGIKTLCGIKDMTHIAMGARASSDTLLKIADIRIHRADMFSDVLKRELDCGKSYNAACTTALNDLYGKMYSDGTDITAAMSDPNNMLCIEYITAIDKFCANVQPIIVERKGAAHGDTSGNGEYISATAIRLAAETGNLKNVSRYIPYCYDEICAWQSAHAADIDGYKMLCLYAFKSADTEFIREKRNCSEGLEFLLKNAPAKYDLDSYVDVAVNKRYGKKRIYRLFLDILLGIDKTYAQKAYITRLLACKNGFNFGILPDYVKTTNADIKFAAMQNKEVSDILSVDVKATDLYNTVCRTDGNYFNYSLIKV